MEHLFRHPALMLTQKMEWWCQRSLSPVTVCQGLINPMTSTLCDQELYIQTLDMCEKCVLKVEIHNRAKFFHFALSFGGKKIGCFGPWPPHSAFYRPHSLNILVYSIIAHLHNMLCWKKVQDIRGIVIIPVFQYYWKKVTKLKVKSTVVHLKSTLKKG